MSVKSFDVAPSLAYGDASFFVALLEENEQFHDECMDFSAKLEAAKNIVVLSALRLDEIWYALLRIVPKSIDKYGHGTNSGYPETFGIQKLDRSTHRQDVIPVGRSVVWH